MVNLWNGKHNDILVCIVYKKQFIDLATSKRMILLLPYVIICCIFLILLPIDLINDGVYAYSNGPAVSFLTVILGLNIISWVILILINIIM